MDGYDVSKLINDPQNNSADVLHLQWILISASAIPGPPYTPRWTPAGAVFFQRAHACVLELKLARLVHVVEFVGITSMRWPRLRIFHSWLRRMVT